MKKLWIFLLAAACLTTMGFAEEGIAPSASPTASLLPSPEEVIETDATLGEASEESQDMPVDESPDETTDGATDAAAGDFVLWFEEGFSLTLPEGWVSYPIAEADRVQGLRYMLSDADGNSWLYIQRFFLDIDTQEALVRAIEANPTYEKTGEPSFGGTDFVSFIDNDRNASCCGTLWDGGVLTFVFTSSDGSDTMLTASQLMESFSK